MFVEEEKWSTGVHSVSNDFIYEKPYVGLKHQDLPVSFAVLVMLLKCGTLAGRVNFLLLTEVSRVCLFKPADCQYIEEFESNIYFEQFLMNIKTEWT